MHELFIPEETAGSYRRAKPGATSQRPARYGSRAVLVCSQLVFDRFDMNIAESEEWFRELLPDAKLRSDLLKILLSGDKMIELESGSVEVRPDVTLTVVYRSLGFSDLGLAFTPVRARIAVGGIESDEALSIGAPSPRLCWATLHYNEHLEVVTCDIDETWT